jgi:Type I phosphodiesterase / nucleotide pyrophosphatase
MGNLRFLPLNNLGEMSMGTLSRIAGSALLAFACSAGGTQAAKADDDGIKHVLLVSVDGLHAVDLGNCKAAGTCPHLAHLTAHGITYTNASTTKPSDSFPGMLAQVTGATSKSTGVFYDDSYDRTLFAPSGGGAGCVAGPGAETLYAEPIDTDLHSIDGGVPASLTGTNSGVAIDPTHLPGALVASGHCMPVWPHDFVRTNSLFGIIHGHHLRTAWSDKHPAYDILNGNDPDNQPRNGPGTNIDDFFAPEINSDLSQANVNRITTELGANFSTAPTPPTDPNCPGVNCGSDFTSTIPGVEWYDGIKVRAVLNEINGLDHTGKRRVGTPTIFGMNFQAVSVGQKVTGDGYVDSRGTPSPGLADAIGFVDRSVGQMVEALQDRNLADNTLIILSAKHGQSPIDVHKLHKIAEASLQAAVNAVGQGLAFDVADDVALLWLNNQGDTKAVADSLSANHLADLSIGEILSGAALTLRFQDPLHDARTPDIIVTPDVGVIYSLSKKKIAEHGGFAEDDVHVALVVSNPRIDEGSIDTGVQTTQIAPTILRALDLDPQELDGVRLEGTQVLPGLM